MAARLKRHATGAELRALLDTYGLRGNDATARAARLLGVSQNAVQAYFSRGLRRNDLELLRYKLDDQLRAAIAKAIQKNPAE
jgi:predicted transcriptional regulator